MYIQEISSIGANVSQLIRCPIDPGQMIRFKMSLKTLTYINITCTYATLTLAPTVISSSSMHASWDPRCMLLPRNKPKMDRINWPGSIGHRICIPSAPVLRDTCGTMHGIWHCMGKPAFAASAAGCASLGQLMRNPQWKVKRDLKSISRQSARHSRILHRWE
jgi:hypothetical protein